MNVPLNIDWQQILLHLFNFVILFAILYFLLYEPVKKFMDKRCEYYKNVDDEAKENLRRSEEMKNEYSEKLRLADGEIEEKKLAEIKAVKEMNEKLTAQANAEASKIVSEAHKKAEYEYGRMLENAQSEIADMAVRAAEKIVLKSNTQETYDDFLNSVKRSDTDGQ